MERCPERVVKNSDWTGPAEYVPALYEQILDEVHRHIMGVHTPDLLGEIIVADAVRDGADKVHLHVSTSGLADHAEIAGAAEMVRDEIYSAATIDAAIA